MQNPTNTGNNQPNPQSNQQPNTQQNQNPAQPVNQASQNIQPAGQGGNFDAGSMLSKFAESDFTGMKQVVKFVKDGHKLDNAAMQELLYRLKTKHKMTYRELLSVYLTMDMAVEKGALTNDIIEYLKKNPQMIQKF
ncbi:hypothetical protein GF362_01610 [Candidatus Dojkabacteria bacterium]|nr:hypothetical protein [Candidatus Dojkabacteria bacterium]